MVCFCVASLLLAFFSKIFVGATEIHDEYDGGHKNWEIECKSDEIVVTVHQNNFHGMIYPKGLPKNSTCLAEYEHSGTDVVYKLPLRSCNTMAHETEAEIEYYNTVVVEPHQKLMTKDGKGLTVRCHYPKNAEDQTSLSKKASKLPLPNSYMKILVLEPKIGDFVVAENVKIGDKLDLVVKIDEQETYGMKVTNCIVRDGLQFSESALINNEGCPIDEDIMGFFEYSENLTEARVEFPAHKFPFISSVYYQCSVKLCLKEKDGCDDVPPVCDKTGHNIRRRRRKREETEVANKGNLDDLRLRNEDLRDKSVEVYSGLYVNEVGDYEDTDTDPPATLPTKSDDDFCVSTRKFAIGIAIAGVLLMLAVIMLVAYIVHRRRRRKETTADSSIYSGPYSNHAYSRD